VSDKKKNATKYPAMTSNDGHSCVKPALDFKAEVAMTSPKIAIKRNSQ
jgi:hypothetical protein